MDDELIYLGEPPLMGGHLPFDEIEISPPPRYRVMDVCNVTLDQLNERILQQRHRYFPNDPHIRVSVSIEKVIFANTRRNPREIMV